MAFPISPTNGQSTTINGVTYVYASATRSWTISPQTAAGLVNPSLFLNTATASNVATLVDSISTTGNVYVKWTITAKDNTNTRFTSTIIDSVNDGTNVYYSQYGTIKSNASANVATFTSNISGGLINLYATGDSTNVSVTYQRTVLGNASPIGYLNVGPQGPAGTDTLSPFLLMGA